MCADMEYPYVINVIRILLEHFTQKFALIGLSLNLLIKVFWNKCKNHIEHFHASKYSNKIYDIMA